MLCLVHIGYILVFGLRKWKNIVSIRGELELLDSSLDSALKYQCNIGAIHLFSLTLLTFYLARTVLPTPFTLYTY